VIDEFLFFWGHTGEGTGPWVFSQWWPAPFTVDDRLFPTAEHWMMWRKAALFGDHAAADAVLAAATPAQAKALGRGVRGFDAQVWARERFGIVVDGSVAKFGSDPALRDYLLSTGQRTLVEASPDDAVWGIGLPAEHPDARSPDRWPGLNLLGQALMAARGELGTVRP
jgi:ribA/ribD-fused uncharacterized protein